MIKLEHVVLASPEQMEFIIEGMRNPMNSWGKSDSYAGCRITEDDNVTGNHPVGEPQKCETCAWCEPLCYGEPERRSHILGPNDHSLIQRLANAGTDHRKFMRMMPVYVRITAPLYWWKEFDTYKVGTVANSCSTMHKIQEKEFTLEDFSCEHLMTKEAFAFPLGGGWRGLDTLEVLKCTIEALNNARKRYLATKDKKYWWQMIQLLPSSYNQTRNVMMNYEVLANIYKSRKDHKLDEWREFCKWIEELPYSELIIGKED